MAGEDEVDSSESRALWRAVGIAGAIAGGAAASVGTGYLREPPPTNGNGYALEARVRGTSEEVAALKAALGSLVSHVDTLSAERERRMQGIERRVEELYDRDRQADVRLRQIESRGGR